MRTFVRGGGPRDLAGDGGSTDGYKDTWWEIKSPGNVRISQARLASFFASSSRFVERLLAASSYRKVLPLQHHVVALVYLCLVRDINLSNV